MAQPKPKTASQITISGPKRPGGKLGDLLTRIESKKGASLTELSERLQWQPHTARAAITRLRQRGYPIVLDKEGKHRVYRIGGTA